jgi:hypothetical protein
MGWMGGIILDNSKVWVDAGDDVRQRQQSSKRSLAISREGRGKHLAIEAGGADMVGR